MYLSIINIHKYLKQKVAFGFGVEEQEFVVRREGPERGRAQGFRFVAYVADLDHGIQAQDAAQRSGVGFVSRAVNLAHGFLQRLDAVFKLLDEPELGFLARRDDVLVDHVHHGHGFHLLGADVVLQEDGLSCFALTRGEDAHLLEELGVFSIRELLNRVDARVDAPDALLHRFVRPLGVVPVTVEDHL